MNAQTLTDHMRFVTYVNRMAAWLTASLGGLALLLTTLGFYGITSCAVSRRTHEIGIRMALGAMRETVFRSVLEDGVNEPPPNRGWLLVDFSLHEADSGWRWLTWHFLDVTTGHRRQ